MVEISPRTQRLIRAAMLMHGEDRWASPMARRLGISPTYVSLMASGGKQVTGEVEKRLLQVLQQERKRMKAVSAELAEIIAEIKQEQNDG
jgi:hypothetical protein